MQDIRRNEKQLGKSRQYSYNRIKKLFHLYFKNNNANIPLLPNISQEDLRKFKNWYYKNYKYTAETRSTYLGIVTSIFNTAVDQKKIKSSPVPRRFTPNVKTKDRKERYIIEELDRKELFNLNDGRLNKKELIAKFVMIVQLTTGMAYCDIKALKRNHVNSDRLENEWFIEKNREKSGEKFKVTLVEAALYSSNKLRELAAGTDTIFDLPKLRVINKQYKRLAKYADVETFTSYDLRHTFAVDFMDYKVGTIEELAEIMGHVELDTTRIYAKISEKRRNKTMRTLGERSPMHKLNFINI